ncbi:UrcA family protein [Sphingobium nicotianae]|uniref:UrcA family protein n=1 Tax=Sphingobium nicotianae TaxID=2782607 RepID=A0A9X1DD95_9SPHN|nr:UrcA family protein [Sphingobium nicotianae]MBT2188042.1 UrcA family protein [Sphingobium nicotianae]
MKKLMIALAATALTVSPALAGEIVAAPETVTVNVSTQGLNLADAHDVARLQARVRKAVVAACNPRTSLSIYVGPDRACSTKAAADGQQMVARITAEAAKSRMAEF